MQLWNRLQKLFFAPSKDNGFLHENSELYLTDLLSFLEALLHRLLFVLLLILLFLKKDLLAAIPISFIDLIWFKTTYRIIMNKLQHLFDWTLRNKLRTIGRTSGFFNQRWTLPKRHFFVECKHLCELSMWLWFIFPCFLWLVTRLVNSGHRFFSLRHINFDRIAWSSPRPSSHRCL